MSKLRPHRPVVVLALIAVIAAACQEKAQHLRERGGSGAAGADDVSSAGPSPQSPQKAPGSGSGAAKSVPIPASGVTPNPTQEFSFAYTAINRPRLGDRFYVAAVFKDIFGPTAVPVVTPTIANNGGTFGSPCDLFGPASDNCNGDTATSQASLLPSSLATREGLRLRACENLALQDGAITYGVAQIPGARTIDVPGSSHIDAVYGLFYPGQIPNDEVRAGLASVVHQATADGKSLDGWRFLFLTVCLAPDWQLL